MKGLYQIIASQVSAWRAAFEAVDFEMDNLWTRILSDDGFVKDYKLEALRESLALDYPSYILALAMGAGKTLLIGAIIATEFAMAMGRSSELVLRNTSAYGQAEIDAFNRLNDPSAPHRVMQLVNKGTEGWDCPSLFACALACQLKSSNNFVLQAATRCLRQVPGNAHPARIYLSMDNRVILDKQLQETYGQTIADLDHAGRESRSVLLKLRKLNLLPLVVTQLVRTVRPMEKTPEQGQLAFTMPASGDTAQMTRSVFTIMAQQGTDKVLTQLGDDVAIDTAVRTVDLYTAAVSLAETYRLDLWPVYDALTKLYGDRGELPLAHLDDLARQIEARSRRYEVTEERVDVALALVKPEGFLKSLDPEGAEVFTAEIRYPVDRQQLHSSWEEMADNRGHFGFHYTPYNFDSNPEKSFFEQLLLELNTRPSEVEDIYFTGALTDPSKTDFFVEYKDDKGKWRRYTPDFIICKKGRRGKCLIVENKREHDRDHPLDGAGGRKAMALPKLEKLNPDRLKYEIIFTDKDTMVVNQLATAKAFIESKDDGTR